MKNRKNRKFESFALRALLAAGLGALLGLGAAAPVAAAPPAPRAVVTDPNGNLSNFGSALAAETLDAGDLVYVGAPGRIDPVGDWQTGAVYVYTDNGTTTPTLVRTIAPPATDNNDPRFGESIALGSGKLLVGAPRAAEGSFTRAGTAFVYDLAGPDPLAPAFRLANPDPEDYDDFGLTLAIGPDYYVVGAPRHGSGGAVFVGIVYLYSTNGVLLKSMISPNGIEGEFFGGAIAVVGTEIFISASGFKDAGNNLRGAVYVFNGDSSTRAFGTIVRRMDRPAPADPASSVHFGHGLASWNDYLLVADDFSSQVFGYNLTPSAPNYDSPAFTLDTPHPTDLDARFGEALAWRGNQIIVGAPSAPSTPGGRDSVGAVYIYDGDPASPHMGTFLSELKNPSDPSITDLFGNAVALSPRGGNIFVGAKQDNGWAGGVYFYSGVPTIRDVVFGVNRAMSDFNVSVTGEGGLTVNFQPEVFGSVGGTLITGGAGGGVLGLQITDVNLRTDDITSETPFHFEIRGAGAFMGSGRGAPGPPAPPDRGGNFTQGGNLVEFNGNALVTIGGADFTAAGGPGSGQLPVDLPGNIAPNPRNPDTFNISMPFNIVRTVANGSGPFNPVIIGSGELVLSEASVLPPPSPKPYLLGETADPTGLDHNTDGAVDIADLVYAVIRE